ncbi:hypothetical protein IC218_20305 [Clostridioides sp. ES-S-0005-03]|uniref:hypothetical protein n=1 Tax=Clostridioides sp. ES-S-0005-03 TaxID=2770774 RepID=UPI001D1178E7|nr:hypothetical protein [Clostridioides sp. ES-S-0005-03]
MGKYHINSFVALMNNWKNVIAYQEQYKQGLMVGSSDKENKRFVDSAEGKMIQLSEGLKKLVTTTISTDMFKGVLDVAISFVNVLDKIVSGFEKIGMSIPLAVGTIGGLFATIKGLGTTGAIPNYFANTMNKLMPVTTKSIKDGESAIKSYANSQARLNDYQKRGLLPIVNYNKKIEGVSDSYKKFSSNIERTVLANNKMNQTSLKGVKASKETANAMKQNARSLYMMNSASKDIDKLNNGTKRNLPIVNYNKDTGKVISDYNKLYTSSQKVVSVNNKVNESSMKGIKASKETSNSMKQSAEAMKQNADARKESIRSLYAVNSASKKTGESANSASKGVNELNDGMKRSMVGSLLANTGVTLLNGAFLGLATAGISTAVKMIDEYVRRNEIAKEQAEERIQVTQDEINEYKSQKDGLKSIQKEYDTLYNKSNKTPEELERYKALTKEIAELMPELVVGTDSDGNAILNMRGDVSDLISDLDEAIARKEALMAGDKEEAGKIALDELNEKDTGKVRKQGVNGFFDQVVNYKDAKEKLAGIQNETNSKIVETESKMNKALLMAQTENDGQREKALAEYRKYYEERQKIVDSGESEYQSKLNEIQKTSNEAGAGIFAGIKSDISFSDFTSKIQSEILSLQGSLDFSDFTREEFPKVQNAIMALGSSGIDLSNFKKSLDETNKAFQSGQISVGDYNKKIDELAKLASDGTGYDVDFWKDMLDGITQGSYEASRGVESFLKSFNKTDNDLRNGDSMAKTLKRQFETVNTSLGEIASPTITTDVVLKMSEDKDMPSEIRSLLGEFADDQEITPFEQTMAIKVMLAFQQGDTKEARQALEKINEELNKEGLEPINIDALFNDKEAVEEIGAFEARLNQFKDKDIAIKIKDNTNIKSVKELDILDEQLNKFKDKDTKLNFIADCGQAFEGVNSLDEAIKNIPLKNLVKYDIDVSNDKKLQQMKNDYESLPKDVKYIIDTEVIGQEHIGKVKDMIEKLPTNREMTLKFMEENKDVIEDAKDYQDILDNLAKNPDVALKYGIKIEGIEEFEKVKGLFDSITDKNLQKKFANFSIQYPDNIDVIKSLFDNAPSGKKEATLSFMIENADKLQMVQELFDKTPDEQKEAVINFIVNNLDQLEKAKNVQEFISNLPPEIKKQLGIEVEGGENAEKLQMIQELFDKVPDETRNKVVNFAVENADELERVTKLYESTPDEQKNQVLNFMLNNEDKLYLIEQLYNDFPESKDIIANLIVNNPDALDEVENLNALDLDKDVKINIIKSLANGDINSLIAEIEKLPPEKQVEVIATVEGAIAGIDSVDKKTLRDKWAKLKANNSAALATIRQTENKKLSDKSFTITAHLRTVGTLGGIASQFANNILDGLNSNRKSVKTSLETPQPIPANLSQPRTSEPVPISDETPVTKPSLFSRAVSRATAPIKALKTLTQDTPIDKNFDAIIKYEIELFKELENQLSKVTNELSLLDKQMKNATNEQKLNYLKKQNELYKEQERLLNRKESLTKDEANRFKKVLSDKGFKFNSDGNMTNYEELAIKKEKELAKLEAEANKEKASDKTKKKYEDAKKVWDETKKYRDEYLDIMFTELPKVVEEKQEVVNATKDIAKAERELRNEAWKLHKESEWTSMNRDVEEVNNQLELLDVLMGSAFGVEKNDLLQQKLDLLEKQKKEMSETTAYMKQSQNEIKGKLQGFGFQFRDDGTITNYIQQLDKLFQSNDNFDEAKELVDAYLDLMMDKIPDAEKEMAKLDATIKAALKEKLETTKEIEDEITKVYEKQIEERKKQIDDELKKRLDALNKEKEAYNKARDKADYQRDYDDKSKEIEELQKKLDIAERDSSLSGQKKIQELRKELEEAKRALEDLVQDQIDKDVNDMYDDESDRLQDEADKAKEDLDNKYTKEELARLIKEALNTGLFTDINGEVHDLQQTLLDFADKYGYGLGATGAIIKSELVGNLEIAKKVMEDMLDIQDKLGVGEYSNYSVPRGRSYQPQQSNQNQFNYNAPLVSVQGTMNRDILKEVEKMIKKSQDELAKEIIRKTKY